MLQRVSQALPMVMKCRINLFLQTDKMYVVIKNEKKLVCMC